MPPRGAMRASVCCDDSVASSSRVAESRATKLSANLGLAMQPKARFLGGYRVGLAHIDQVVDPLELRLVSRA